VIKTEGRTSTGTVAVSGLHLCTVAHNKFKNTYLVLRIYTVAPKGCFNFFQENWNPAGGTGATGSMATNSEQSPIYVLMVLFYTSLEGYVIYMGADKHENEDLIKYGLPEDFWFHVDDMSSAHVYLRLRKNQRLEDVSPETIMECAQLVKANSIEGCKLKEVKVGKDGFQCFPVLE
jgi:hypothetical protein